MAWSEWWAFREGMVESDLERPGVYEFADSSSAIVYIGSSNCIKRRLKEHLSQDSKSCIKKNAVKYRVNYTSDYVAEEKRLYAEIKRAIGYPPLCNDISP